jgi:hypothetical protein
MKLSNVNLLLLLRLISLKESILKRKATPDSFIYTWLINPVSFFFFNLLNFSITTYSFFFKNSLLYNNSFKIRKAFLNPRDYVLFSIGYFVLIGGNLVNIPIINTIQNSTVKKVAETFAESAAIILLVFLTALIFFLAPKYCKGASKMSESLGLAAYSTGGLIVLKYMLTPILSFPIKMLADSFTFKFIYSFLTIIFLFLLVGKYCLYRPLRYTYPYIKPRTLIFKGIILAWLTIFLPMCGFIILLFFLGVREFHVGF